MVAIFLVPAAGFYYNKHSCTKSGEVMLVMDKDYSCCAVDVPAAEPACCSEESQSPHEVVSDEASACCSEKASMELNLTEKECCSNEGSYLKTDEKYTSPSKTEISSVEISFTITFNSIRLFSAPDLTVEVNAHSPPLILP